MAEYGFWPHADEVLRWEGVVDTLNSASNYSLREIFSEKPSGPQAKDEINVYHWPAVKLAKSRVLPNASTSISLKDYTGSGNSAIHKALVHLRDATRGPISGDFMSGFRMLDELLRDLREAEQAQSIEKLMDKWEPKFPSGFVDLLITDLPAAISSADELLKAARSKLILALEAISGDIIAVTAEQLHSPEFLKRKVEGMNHGKETIVHVYFDLGLSEKLGPRVAVFKFEKNELPTLSALARKMESRFPLHVKRNVQFYIDGKLEKAETHVIDPSEVVTAIDFGKPSDLGQGFIASPPSGYVYELQTRYSDEAAIALAGYQEQIREIIAGARILWEDLFLFHWQATKSKQAQGGAWLRLDDIFYFDCFSGRTSLARPALESRLSCKASSLYDP